MPSGSGGDELPPVPDDETPPPVTPQLPWSQIPKFQPGVTNVQEYTQKLKFLAALWPVEFLDQLAPRAALLVEGTAFKKVARIPPAKLKVKSTDGVAAIVEAIGGSWGSTELEERYEYFEKSLYGTIQRADESHDSFLARMEANFVELLSRNTTLEEVQAYVLLRQSTLSADDKKRILLEHEGELKYQPVVKSFRLLGSKFFNEFQSGRASQKTKVYDAHVLEESHEGLASMDASHVERVFHASSEDFEPELDQEFIDTLVAQEDADALTVANFEGEFEEFLQETPEMFEALTSYIEARSKLVEKRKSRGFWPVKGKGKSGKSRGKSFGKRSKDRDALLQRISRSHCRRCGALGHWKAECPLNSAAQSNVPSTAASANVVIDERPQEVFHSDMTVDEVISEDEYEMPSTEACLHTCLAEETCFMKSPESLKSDTSRCRFLQSDRSEKDASENVYSSLETFCTHAILDTGASRCIIGEKTLAKLKQSLPDRLSDSFRKKDSQVKFRFGNNQTLTSVYAVQIPLKHKERKKLWLSVEVVPGLTPFLFSKRAFKMLHGSLDSQRDECVMSKVQDVPFHLATSPTGLYLINLLDICPTEETAFFHMPIREKTVEIQKEETNGTMPPMVSVLKTIAEAIIHLLTLLLQILVHQLEKQEVIVESDTQNDPELHASLQEMMHQINVQRASLEALKGEISKSPEKKPKAVMTSGPSQSAGSSVMMTAAQPKNLTQRRVPAPSVTSVAPSWEEVEEIEEIVVQETVSVAPVSRVANRGQLPDPTPLTLPLPGNLSLEEWGTNTITFGRKHKGKSYAEVMQKDPGYLQWSLARYHSLMPEHQDFVRYGQLWEREIGRNL
eukprot:s526_g2.t1